MKNAAVALLLGMDPMVYLRMSRFEERIVRTVIEIADKLAFERKKYEIEAIGNAVANALGKFLR